MKGLILILGFSLFWLTACAQEVPETATQTEAESNEPQMIRVSKASFKTILDANPGVTLVDLRTPTEYNGEKIGDAVNIDFLNSSFGVEISKLEKDSLTLIYCKSGGRSSRALSQMEALGFTNVRELEGGCMGW